MTSGSGYRRSAKFPSDRAALQINGFPTNPTTVVCLAMSLLAGFTAGAGEAEIHVGRSSSGQIRVHIEFDQPFVLPVSIFPGITGYATGEMGIHSTILDEPAEDLYQLSTDADFRMILLAKDPGMEIYTASGFMGIGDMYYVGQPPFDTHPLWDLVHGTPGNSYSLTLKLRDLNAIYPDSDPFILSFTGEPSPPLAITLTATNSLVVSWPLPAEGWVLEQTSTLAGNSVWTPVSTPYQTNSAQSWITVVPGGDSAFYRLRKP